MPLNRYLGRRTAIRTAAILALGPIVIGLSLNGTETTSLVMMIVIVLLWLVSTMMSAVAMVILGCTIPLYLAETSVAASRGRRIATWHWYVSPSVSD